MQESFVYQEILEEGVQEGRQEGMQRGRQEGITEAKAMIARNLLSIGIPIE